MTLCSYEARSRVGEENQLLKVAQLVNWEGVSNLLKGLYKRDKEDKGGQRPYDSLKMFKAILLGQWHSLSDPKLEEGLRVRLDFMLFTGFELSDDLPDETTLCRFRNRLVKAGLDQKLFEVINEGLEKLGLKLEECEGAVVDATLITSANRPNRVLELNEDTEQIRQEVSKDREAVSLWLPRLHAN